MFNKPYQPFGEKANETTLYTVIEVNLEVIKMAVKQLPTVDRNYTTEKALSIMEQFTEELRIQSKAVQDVRFKTEKRIFDGIEVDVLTRR